MGSQTQGKLNWLQGTVPEGLVVDSGWLKDHHISRQLTRKYVQKGWLLPLARGVYRRPSPPEPRGPLPWQQLVISLNAFGKEPVSVGARTALEMQGFSHYLLASGAREAHVFSNWDLPQWVSRVPVDARLVFHSSMILFENCPIPPYKSETTPAPASSADSTFIKQPWERWKWPLVLSTPERAILELLYEVPQRETFHQADVLMEGLRNLSPKRLQMLLEDCRSVKVKRLFFWFAERHNHAWLQRLDPSKVDLGKGKRMLVRGGKLDPKYNITVPEKLDAGI
jgi:hypothetical protein